MYGPSDIDAVLGYHDGKECAEYDWFMSALSITYEHRVVITN